MKVAAIYDIHGNLPALEAVLQEIEQARPDLIVVGGDIVYGPMPQVTLERLRALGERVRFIRGNTEREVIEAFDGSIHLDLPREVREIAMWTAHQLERNQLDFIAGLPEHMTLSVDGLGEVLFCHASPRRDDEIFTINTPETDMRTILADVQQDMVVCGHTHMQFDRLVDNVRVVNAGSVGMPYGKPGAYWLLLGPEVVHQRTLYDLEQAATQIRASSYPFADDFAANNVLAPPTEAEALEVFERMTK